jgi:hypothetical protein
MPQGISIWLDPCVFLIHINDIQTTQSTFTFDYDNNIIGEVDYVDRSQMQSSVDAIAITVMVRR